MTLHLKMQLDGAGPGGAAYRPGHSPSRRPKQGALIQERTAPMANVLLNTADQFAAIVSGRWGTISNPHLDALKARRLFRNHYCQATPCPPARASLLPGYTN